MTILEILAPFKNNVSATGKAAYIGPADIAPVSIESNLPLNPDSFPNVFIITSDGTHTVINAEITKIGGKISTISIRKSLVIVKP